MEGKNPKVGFKNLKVLLKLKTHTVCTMIEKEVYIMVHEETIHRNETQIDQ